LSSYLAVQEIKRLHHSERKEFAKYYLDYVKKYKNHTNEFLNDLITKSVLIPFDLNQFNIAVFIHFDFFIDEVERLTGLSESKLHPQKETGKEIFDPKIFQDQRSFDLFLFLVEEYATTKQPKQFSQIFHWMQENDNSIKPNTGVKFREFVVKRFPEMVAKFSRIEEKKTYEMTTLNGKLKEFNSLNKV
jgi:hypothetical protein